MSLELGREEDRAALTWRFLDRELLSIHASAPTLAGILVGGQSRRMGRSKHLLELDGQTWLARIVDAVSPVVEQVLLLGAGTIPPSCSGLSRLPDVPGCAGPVAGMRSALRFRPDARWIFLACDAPLVSTQALSWLKAQSRPGVLAVLPRLDRQGAPQPMPGWYDPQVARILEAAAGPSALVAEPRTVTPIVPADLTRAWWGCNTTAELRHLSEGMAGDLRAAPSHPFRGLS
jgi:molybdopterin-guanine dinucleotide biosynthesis protein A